MSKPNPGHPPRTREEMLDFIETPAKATVEKAHGHIPMAFIVDAHDKLSILALVGEFNEGMRKMIRTLFSLAAMGGAKLLGFVSEGWMVRAPKGDTKDSLLKYWREHGTFKDYVATEPDGTIFTRVEVLIMASADPSGISTRFRSLIRRGEKETLLAPPPVDLTDISESYCRFLTDLTWRSGGPFTFDERVFTSLKEYLAKHGVGNVIENIDLKDFHD